jgi:N-acetylneuraminate synthase
MTYVVAEIGINHNGDIDLAMEMIRAAKACGCDAVKFQKRTIDVCYTQEFLDSPRESPWGTTQRDQKQHLEFDDDQFRAIRIQCRYLGIHFAASAWDHTSLMMIDGLGPDWHKIASPMVTNLPFVKSVAALGRPVFISTGMCTEADIDAAVKLLPQIDYHVTILHCVSVYPCPDHLLNLQMIQTLRKKYPSYHIGYSGHETSVSPSVVAAVLGAEVIERHFTLDRASYGSDQAASLEPAGMKSLVDQVNKIGAMMGDGFKTMCLDEKRNAKKLRYWL